MSADEEPGLEVQVDVLIVGSGPIGAVFARELMNTDWKHRQNIKILMVDIGPQDSFRIGEHKKNSVAAQKDVSLFTNVVKGQLQPLSVPTANDALKDPTPYISSGQNPEQDRNTNLTAASATRVVGGMGSHWTCCTPEQDADERAEGFGKVYEHYERAKKLFRTTTTEFDHSVRQQLIMHILTEATVKDSPTKKVFGGRTIKPMPLACHRPNKQHKVNYLEWTCPATILDSGARHHLEKLSDPKYSKVPPPLLSDDAVTTSDKFEVWPNTQCVKLRVKEGKVVSAKLKHLLTNALYDVTADKFVICSGAILTPGILWNSGFGPKADKDGPYYVPQLGKNLTEQTMAFGQVRLWKAHVDSVRTDGATNTSRPQVYDPQGKHADSKLVLPARGTFWAKRGTANATWDKVEAELKAKVEAHLKNHPKDPLPFPADDPDPQCYFPYHFIPKTAQTYGEVENRPWHTQIHRDAFGYGDVPAHVDQRRVVDLRWFGYTKEDPENYVKFSLSNRDEFGMPQPTFHFTETHGKGAGETEAAAKLKREDDEKRNKAMLDDLTKVGNVLGSWIRKPEPLPPGSAIHICGTYKAGHPKNATAADARVKANEDSVVDEFGRMWKHENVVLGGCGVIPKRNAGNPTLTAACFAIHAVKAMVEELDK